MTLRKEPNDYVGTESSKNNTFIDKKEYYIKYFRKSKMCK